MNLTEVFTSIGLGTWNMEKNAQASIKAIHAGLEEGANHIDTAEMYGEGRVEEIVGEAIVGRRKNLYLVSKVLPSNSSYEKTVIACERSLKRLKTDYLDVYLLHWRQARTPLEETFRAFEKLKTDGKIKTWGVSNFDVKDMDDAVRLVGEGKIACNQVYYSIAERAAEEKLLPWCENKKIPLVAYSPLGQGKLPHHATLSEIAKELNATPSQVALAFLVQNKNVISIPKSSDVARTKENVQAMKIKLSPILMEKLNHAFPLKTRRSLPTV